MLSKRHDLRDYLKDELLRRCKKNPKYSLRAFATSLGVHHSFLSMLLRQKRSLTPSLIIKIGGALKFTPRQTENYAQYHQGDKLIPKRGKRYSNKEFNNLSLDAFHVVTEWYHDAIMELLRIEGFSGAPKRIARALGITFVEAQSAIERLIRLGMINVKPDGSGEEIGDYSTITKSTLTSSALRVYQKRILEKSSEALDSVPISHRDHNCIILSVRVEDLEEAKERIKSFRRELMAFLQRSNGSNYDDVYCLSISLFPLTTFYKKETRE